MATISMHLNCTDMESSMQPVGETTRVLQALGRGEDGAAAALLPMVYAELRALAASYMSGQRSDHTLQPTALVHEAFLKLVDQSAASFNDRTHFFAVSARAMRQILVDHARKRSRAKRRPDGHRVDFHQVTLGKEDDLIQILAIDEAIDRLGASDDRQAKIVEMRIFGGMTVDETAAALGVSPRTVELDWKLARARLSQLLSEGPDAA